MTRLRSFPQRGPALLGMLLCLVLLPGTAGRAQEQKAEEMPMAEKLLKKLTPILFVDEIEPCLDFWVNRLGFEKTVEVPEGDKLGFVIVVRDGVEVMLQSRASLAKDVPALAQERSRSFLYIEVADFSAIAQRLQGADIVVPERTTFYGAREIGVREPGGNIVSFAAFEERK